MMTQRDFEILAWIGGLGAVGQEHLRRRFAISENSCYTRLRRLIEEELLTANILLHRRPGMYVATRRGLRWSGLTPLGVARISAGTYAHAWEVATVAVALEERFPGAQLSSVRTIRARERDERELLASVQLGMRSNGVQMLHRPDLALELAPRRTVAIEVELTAKAPLWLDSILRGWARASHVEHVYYLSTPNAARALERAIERVRAEDRITVLALTDVAGIQPQEVHDVAR